MERAVTENDHTRFLISCRKVPERLHIDCLQGISGGLVAHGEPEREYVKALRFCGSSLMTAEEKKVCYRHTFNSLRGIYPESKFKTICALAEKKYQEACLR